MSEPDQDSSPADDESSAQDPRLDHVLAEYLRRVAAGESINREQFIAEHPDVADRLRQYFETADMIQRAAGPAARFDEANIDRDAATLPPSSLAATAIPASDATPEIGSGAQPSALGPPPTRLRYFGDYELLEEIARGGMGVVYKARQVSLNRIVAVKMILAGQLAGLDDVRRFRTEAEAAAQLQHPNIVAIHEVGEHDGQHYFSMDYVKGTSLAALVRENPLPAKQAASIVKTVAEAIHYAHTKGILHRDLKPSNVLMQAESGGQRAESQKADSESGPSEILALSSQRSPLSALRPRLTDFGLAKRIEGGSELTGTGQILGTPSYMPPEQAGAKRGEIGPHSDVYSLGAILYELVTGRPPFRAETPLDTLLQVLDSDPVTPRLLNPKLPRDLETICLKCLSKPSAQRYGTADDLADDLRRYLAGEPIRARRAGTFERSVKWARRHPTTAALVVVSLLATTCLLVGGLWHNSQLAAALQNTQEQKRRANDERLNAIRQRNIADEQRDMAERQQRLAEDRELTVRRYWYTADLHLAWRDWKEGNIAHMIDLLDNHVVTTDQQDVRGFEWFYLWRLCHSDRLTLRGHQNIVQAVAFSPDGHTLVTTGTLDKTVKLWDPSSGEERATIRAHDDIVYAAAFSPDGKTLATSSKDKSVRIWNLEFHEPILTLRGHTGPVFSVAFSKNGRTLASAGGDQTIRLWDVASGEEQSKLDAQSPIVTSLAFSPNGEMLAWPMARFDRDKKRWTYGVQLWDLERNEAQARLECDAAVNSLAFTWDGSRLASGSNDGIVNLWNIDTTQNEARLAGHSSEVLSVAFSADATTLVSGGVDKVVKLWDVATQKERLTLKGHTDKVSSVAFAPDGQTVATGSWDRTVKLWAVKETQECTQLPAHSKRVQLLSFTPDSEALASCDRNGVVKLWDVRTGELRATPPGGLGPAMSMHFSPDGTTLATTGLARNTANLWDLAAGVVRSLELRGRGIRFTFAPDGQTLATGDLNGTVELVDLVTGIVRAKLPGHGQPVYCLAFSPDGKTLATASFDKTVKLWDAATLRERFTLKGHSLAVVSIAFSPDGKILATATANAVELDSPRKQSVAGAFNVWDAQTGNRLLTITAGHAGGIWSVAFSPDGRTIATASSDGTVKLWNPFTGSELIALDGQESAFYTVAFSPDGKTLAAGNTDGTVRLWRAALGLKTYRDTAKGEVMTIAD